MADIENGEQPELDLSDDKVVTKYKAAAEICNSECLPAKQRRLGDRRPGVASGCIYGTISRVRNHKMFICCEASNCSRLRLPPWPLPYEQASRCPDCVVFAEAITAVVEAAKDGAKVVDLCRIGDDVINK
jgi:hypothetical protein